MTSPGGILVTGGTGFVGRVIVRALTDRGYAVRVLSRRVVSTDRALVSIVHGDITSPSDLERGMRECGAVFHCAAEKSDTSRMPAINVGGTQNVVNAAREARVQFLCHLSSVGTIGRTSQPVVDESTPCNPMNAYEATKLAAERIVAEGLPGGRVAILRPTNVFGAETIESFVDNSLRGRVWMFLKGRESAHLVYVKDVAAAAVFLFRQHDSEAVGTYIVSSDEEVGNTNREVQAYLRSRYDGAPQAPVVSAPIAVPHLMRRLRRGTTNRGDVVYSAQRLRALGFEFRYGLRGGLDDAFGLPRLRARNALQ